MRTDERKDRRTEKDGWTEEQSSLLLTDLSARFSLMQTGNNNNNNWVKRHLLPLKLAVFSRLRLAIPQLAGCTHGSVDVTRLTNTPKTVVSQSRRLKQL